MKDGMSVFAHTIMEQKYSMTKRSGRKETWQEIAKRVAQNVMQAIDADEELIKKVEKIINTRKFIPGGRYLYSCGRPYHQVQNCLLLRADDSREGWSELLHKASMALMTGAGIGIVYSDIREEGAKIRKTGGVATGPTALMQMLNECGRGIIQGGNRRAAIWAGLTWKHPDIHKFINLKNWIPEVIELKAKDFSFPATMDMTNISVLLDDDFFKAYNNNKHSQHAQAISVYRTVVKRMMKTGEPGFSIDVGDNVGEEQRNACQPSYATVLTPEGIRTFDDIGVGSIIWSGREWTKVKRKINTGIKSVYKFYTTMGYFTGTEDHKIFQNGSREEVGDAESIDWSIGLPIVEGDELNVQDIMDGLVVGDGTKHKASNNLILLCIGDDDQDYFLDNVNALIIRHRPGISEKQYEIKTTITSEELPKTFNRFVPDRFYFGDNRKKMGFLRGIFSANGSISGDRVSLKQSSYELIRQVQEMLSSIGIRSYITFNKSKKIRFSNGEYEIKKSYDLNITTHRSEFRELIGFIQRYKQDVIKDSGLIKSYTSNIKQIEYVEDTSVFEIEVESIDHSYWTGGCLVSNCTEVTSYDDSDICNLGSINISRIESLEEMREVVELATAFLLAGTVYSDVPYSKVDLIRTKNRRLGLGLMGLHEWLLSHGKKYGPDEELEKYLKIYSESTEISHKYAKEWRLSKPKKTRAIAPTGTIGIIAETTTGIEPIFCVAYKRRYLKGKAWHYQYVIDPTAKRLIDSGINPDHIEDAYTLSEDIERRICFQEWVQQYVDHAISSTINLPSWGSEINNEEKVIEYGDMFMKYLPELRGLTLYPDGARGGQPLTSIKYQTAIRHIGEIFIESADICEISKGGTCGE